LQHGHMLFDQTRGGYPNLHYSVRYDKKNQVETKQLGFSTTGKTKDHILLKFREDYNSGLIKIPSRDLLFQMDGFARDEERHKYVQNNQDPRSELYNDDGIMASAICHKMTEHAQREAHCDQPVIVDC
jgi:hypothetical protein